MTTEAITPLRQRMVEDMNARKLCVARAERPANALECQRWIAGLRRGSERPVHSARAAGWSPPAP